MHLERVTTKDGSDTFFVPGLNEHYHSCFGAVSESRHIFIDAGFRAAGSMKDERAVLEVGFGTGLNALLTLIEAETLAIRVRYTSLEPFPLEKEQWASLNYPSFFCSVDYRAVFRNLHESGWGKEEQVSPHFFLEKQKIRLEDFSTDGNLYDIVYFDAFGPQVQPELWNEDIFRKLFQALKTGGILVTYSVKGSVRRALKAAGFGVEKLPGPKGKREMTRAIKRNRVTG